jgi:Dullard-like phosphatase family protein
MEMAVEVSAAVQTDIEGDTYANNTLSVKQLRSNQASIPDNYNFRTQLGTPDKNESEADSHNLKGNKTCKQKEVIRTFKPCIFHGTEVTIKSAPYFKNAMGNFLLHAFQEINIIQGLEFASQEFIDAHKIILPHTTSNISFKLIEKGTIVFDLDETLSHCTLKDVHLSDYQITVVQSKGKKTSIGVNIRPYAIQCLTELAGHFELIVFTASHRNYADRVIDILDPEHKIFSYRLFRDSCLETNKGSYIKDLRILNRDLSKLLLVDNSILSFGYQLDNGIPIVPFYDNKADMVLLGLKDYLLSLCNVKDYREVNIIKFGLRYLLDFKVQNYLKSFILRIIHRSSLKQGDLVLAGKRKAAPSAEPFSTKKVKEND